MQLIITKSSLGFTVYDPKTLNRIELFPNTNEGFERLMTFLSKYLSQDVLDFKTKSIS